MESLSTAIHPVFAADNVDSISVEYLDDGSNSVTKTVTLTLSAAGVFS